MCRSGSPRPLSKPRNTFALFATPLSRAVRPLCPIRHLARCPSFSIELNETTSQWEKSACDVRKTCVNLRQIYRKEKNKKALKDVFPFAQENNNEGDEDGMNQTLDDFLPEIEPKTNDEELNNLPIRYPKVLNDPGDFYAQYTHSNLTIMKKRPYESSENSTDDPSPKRTLISRQNLIKSKSPVRSQFFQFSSIYFSLKNTGKLPRSRAYTVPFVDRKSKGKFLTENSSCFLAPDGIYLRVTKDIK